MSALDARSFTEATARITSWKHPLLISHDKPDGDALGALVAMRSLLRSRGAEVVALLFDVIPDRYAVFHRYEPMRILGLDIQTTDLVDIDSVLVLDTCTYGQVDPIADWLRGSGVPKLAIDHHVTRDDLADYYLIDESAAATCLILCDWAKAVNWPITAEALDTLFVGMAMDTGWFRHSNTDRRVLEAAADLVARGVDPHELYRELYQCETPARVRLAGAALGTLELLLEDRLAVMALSADTVTGAGATPADTEDIVNEPLRIGSVVVSVLLVEAADGVIRASFRSKPPAEPRAEWNPDLSGARADALLPHPLRSEGRGTGLDVAKVAQAFGGGGHTRAAGARISGTLPAVRRNIIDYLERAFLESSHPDA
ncbi:MAG: DHH family phosphoesterase [Phycisphaerales bacterium]|nr:MAG: DHH family phosphoesterase [Phycisphaerales bacterium]